MRIASFINKVNNRYRQGWLLNCFNKTAILLAMSNEYSIFNAIFKFGLMMWFLS